MGSLYERVFIVRGNIIRCISLLYAISTEKQGCKHRVLFFIEMPLSRAKQRTLQGMT